MTLLCVLASGTWAQGEKYLGTWSGTWDGAGSSGGFELTLETAKEGTLSGRVSVTGEPSYKAALRTVAFEGAQMTAAYDFPGDEAVEVLVTAAFEGNTVKGTWSARQKAGDEIVAGTWTATKK